MSSSREEINLTKTPRLGGWIYHTCMHCTDTHQTAVTGHGKVVQCTGNCAWKTEDRIKSDIHINIFSHFDWFRTNMLYVSKPKLLSFVLCGAYCAENPQVPTGPTYASP